EDELILGPLLGERLLVLDLGGVYFVAIAEHLIERHERRREAAAAAEEIAPAHALPFGRQFADRVGTSFVFLLLRRLGRRNELFVGGNPRRNRQRRFLASIEITLTNPHGNSPKYDHENSKKGEGIRERRV